MWWIPTPESLEEREKLKELIAEIRSRNGTFEEIKEVFVKRGYYDNQFKIANLAGRWEDLMIYLDLSPREWKELNLQMWIS